MSDDLNKKIKQITDILGQENLPDNFKSLLSLLTASGGKQEPPPKSEEAIPVSYEKTERSELDESIDTVRRIKKIMDRINSPKDPRINLLNAIKPFMNSGRQKKLNNCIKMLQLSSLSKFVDENGKENP